MDVVFHVCHLGKARACDSLGPVCAVEQLQQFSIVDVAWSPLKRNAGRGMARCSNVTGFHLLNNSQRQPGCLCELLATAHGDPSHNSVTKMDKLFCEVATKLLTMKTENTQVRRRFQSIVHIFLGAE